MKLSSANIRGLYQTSAFHLRMLIAVFMGIAFFVSTHSRDASITPAMVVS